MGSLPDYVFLGPERTGTTWIHRYLADRGDVRLPSATKETFFFDYNFERGADWYLAHFPEPGTERLTVEVAPTYFRCGPASGRIRAVSPHTQVVCTLREPVERSYSHYRYMCAHGADCELAEAVGIWPEIVEASRYASRLRQLYAEFGSEGVHLLFLEDLSEDAAGFAAQLCEMLDLPSLPPEGELASSRVNATLGAPRHPALARTGYRIRVALRRAGLTGLIRLANRFGARRVFFPVSETPKRDAGVAMSPEELRFLEERLGGEVEALEALLGRRLERWRERRRQLAAAQTLSPSRQE